MRDFSCLQSSPRSRNQARFRRCPHAKARRHRVDHRAALAHSRLNLTAAREREEAARTGRSYAVGFRPDLERRVDLGFELHGALNDAAEEEGHELMLGLYAQASERVTLKAGVGCGFGDADWSFRGGFVIGF